jgi:cell wall-associated NlpC family hydrolase
MGREQQRRANFNAGKGVADAIGNAVGAVTGSGGGPLVAEARKHLGKKYVFGATGPNVFDCSGLVMYCLKQTGIDPNPPRFVTQTWAAYARRKGWIKVARKDIQAGDVVWKSGHMGIAVSNSRMIHAPHTGSVVKEGNIYTPAYMWVGWRRTTVPATNYGKGIR